MGGRRRSHSQEQRRQYLLQIRKQDEAALDRHLEQEVERVRKITKARQEAHAQREARNAERAARRQAERECPGLSSSPSPEKSERPSSSNHEGDIRNSKPNNKEQDQRHDTEDATSQSEKQSQSIRQPQQPPKDELRQAVRKTRSDEWDPSIAKLQPKAPRRAGKGTKKTDSAAVAEPAKFSSKHKTLDITIPLPLHLPRHMDPTLPLAPSQSNDKSPVAASQPSREPSLRKMDDAPGSPSGGQSATAASSKSSREPSPEEDAKAPIRVPGPTFPLAPHEMSGAQFGPIGGHLTRPRKTLPHRASGRGTNAQSNSSQQPWGAPNGSYLTQFPPPQVPRPRAAEESCHPYFDYHYGQNDSSPMPYGQMSAGPPHQQGNFTPDGQNQSVASALPLGVPCKPQQMPIQTLQAEHQRGQEQQVVQPVSDEPGEASSQLRQMSLEAVPARPLRYPDAFPPPNAPTEPLKMRILRRQMEQLENRLQSHAANNDKVRRQSSPRAPDHLVALPRFPAAPAASSARRETTEAQHKHVQNHHGFKTQYPTAPKIEAALQPAAGGLPDGPPALTHSKTWKSEQTKQKEDLQHTQAGFRYLQAEKSPVLPHTAQDNIELKQVQNQYGQTIAGRSLDTIKQALTRKEFDEFVQHISGKHPEPEYPLTDNQKEYLKVLDKHLKDNRAAENARRRQLKEQAYRDSVSQIAGPRNDHGARGVNDVDARLAAQVPSGLRQPQLFDGKKMNDNLSATMAWNSPWNPSPSRTGNSSADAGASGWPTLGEYSQYGSERNRRGLPRVLPPPKDAAPGGQVWGSGAYARAHPNPIPMDSSGGSVLGLDGAINAAAEKKKDEEEEGCEIQLDEVHDGLRELIGDMDEFDPTAKSQDDPAFKNQDKNLA